MNYQRATKAIIYATVAAWTILLWINHQAVHSTWFAPLSTATTVVLGLVSLFELYLWKLRIFQGWFVKRPVIAGTWKAEIRSNWQNPDTGQPAPPITAYMIVRQTLSTLSMRLLTAESNSSLIGTEIVCSPDGIYCVSGVYRNEPAFSHRSHSPIHYGALWLQISDNDNERAAEGHYWTDRETTGEIRLSNRLAAKAQTFQNAVRLFLKPIPR